MQLTVNTINQQKFALNNEYKKNSINKNISFEMAPGNFLYKDAPKQQKALAKALVPVFEKGSDFAFGIEDAIKKTFPFFNFQLGNISDLQYNSVKKEQPLLFFRTSFKNPKPKTFLYMNFPEFITIGKDKSARRIQNVSESIASNVALANEPHFVSKVVDMCTEKVNGLSSITIKAIDKIVRDCLKAYKIDIDNVVLDKEQADKISELARQSKQPITDVTYNEGNVNTKLCIIMDDTDKAIRRAISHEFTHTLNANSKWINESVKELFSTPDAPVANLDFAPTFGSLFENNMDFLNMPAEKRGEEYEKILKQALSNVESKRDKKLLFDQALKLASDESLAYSQSPGLFNEYRQNATSKIVGGTISVPYGWFYIDFYDFLLAVKNNEALYNSIANSN